MKLLILRLEGVLQSWGEGSHWDHRDTSAMPTKSGIIGLLGCALGYGRGDERLATLANALTFAVRADRPGTVMTDFHTVQSRGGKMLNAEGKPRGDTILTPHGYLEDACFTVFLGGRDDVLEDCAEALRHPQWVSCLGRRSCPPMRPMLPVMTEQFATVEDAVEQFIWEGRDARPSAPCMLAEIEDAAGEKIRRDQPINASCNQYAMRRVRIKSVRKEKQACT